MRQGLPWPGKEGVGHRAGDRVDGAMWYCHRAAEAGAALAWAHLCVSVCVVGGVGVGGQDALVMA